MVLFAVVCCHFVYFCLLLLVLLVVAGFVVWLLSVFVACDCHCCHCYVYLCFLTACCMFVAGCCYIYNVVCVCSWLPLLFCLSFLFLIVSVHWYSC